jgi:enoyl-CoA hydratase/carnithine racemase
MHDVVTVTRHGPVAVLTLNAPAQPNALSSRMVGQIDEALSDLEAMSSVSAVVVTGAGSSFCARAEVATLERAADGDFSLPR